MSNPIIIPLDCTTCAKCCSCSMTVGLLIGVDTNIPTEMITSFSEADLLLLPEKTKTRYFGKLKQRENGTCIALDETTHLCTIQENKPAVCKRFERGGDDCLEVLNNVS